MNSPRLFTVLSIYKRKQVYIYIQIYTTISQLTTDHAPAVVSPSCTFILFCFCVCYKEQTILLIFLVIFEDTWGPKITIQDKINCKFIEINKYVHTKQSIINKTWPVTSYMTRSGLVRFQRNAETVPPHHIAGPYA